MKDYNSFLIWVINIAYDCGFNDAISKTDGYSHETKSEVIEEVFTSDLYEKYYRPSSEKTSPEAGD